MFIKEILSLYKQYKMEHREEVAKYKAEKMIAKHPFNYVLLEGFLKTMIDSNKRDLVIETKTSDGVNVKIYFDNDKNKWTHKTTIEKIMNGE